ncbi:protein of unknown function DUF95 transmembrane [Methanocaldococcus infernus ME]|uniref:Stage II sporulation protein M n=1 Tax=Methanocaldococcus infernus (strain DSM 11812 / JCM 15783 / ME) TaxID=573063 RepID=D5VTR3_METIM|nr:stage II sporulation protein M [Methanocaldococcus infernus]ADG13966.1 protein of unknown function DUF95 transmembrane [Methanocaldococcus infernus ME]
MKLYEVLPIVLFLIFFVFGYFTKIPTYDNTPNIDINTIFPNTFLGILSNNLKVILTNLSGSVLFGLSTFVNMLYNGYILGVQAKIFTVTYGVYFVLITTIPHCIFEIPAMLIAAIAGFKIPYEITLYLLDRKEKPITEEDIKEFLKLALISIILIIIAAFVEVYITPEVAKLLM